MTAPEVDRRLADAKRFLYLEAAILEDRRWDDWLALWAEDGQYVMPVRSEQGPNRRPSPVGHGFSEAGELHYFDEPKPVLAARVLKLQTGKAWAEQPASHTTRLITNIHIEASADTTRDTITVRSNFLVHRTRGECGLEQFVGTRIDRLRPDAPGWLIARRTVFLNTSVLAASNLEIFF